MTRPGDLARFARTAARLRPAQVTQRARLRAQRVALHRVPACRPLAAGRPGPGRRGRLAAGFTPLDAAVWRDWPGLPGLQAGRIELLGLSRRLAGPAAGAALAALGDPADSDGGGTLWPGTDWAAADWAQRGAPLLWRFHLHYWDWAWALAAAPGDGEAAADVTGAREWFTALWTSWQAAVIPGRGAAWLPYPASLRAWSWCGLHRPLVAGTPVEQAFTASLAAHAGFLWRHLETDVGGNHLIKNLKALAGLGVFLGDGSLLEARSAGCGGSWPSRCSRTAAITSGPPPTTARCSADLIDVAGLLRSAGREPGPELTDAISRMRRWLGCVLSPAGEVPLLNDGYPVSATLLSQLQPGPVPGDPLLVLPDSGLARLTAGRWQVLADVGAPCPDDLPAHAHADTLSCLVHVDGVPLLVDTGTSGYAAGPARSYERSTAAHNTVTVDGADSTEVWGAFRAARLARVSGIKAGADGSLLTAEAGHDGFRRLPGRPRHHRRWSLTPRRAAGRRPGQRAGAA